MCVLPFDPENPPPEPPPGLTLPLLWRVAERLRAAHSLPLLPPAGQDEPQYCQSCGETWPCRDRSLAEQALVVACELPPFEPPASDVPWLQAPPP